jgi:hypothetical protein
LLHHLHGLLPEEILHASDTIVIVFQTAHGAALAGAKYHMVTK